MADIICTIGDFERRHFPYVYRLSRHTRPHYPGWSDAYWENVNAFSQPHVPMHDHDVSRINARLRAEPPLPAPSACAPGDTLTVRVGEAINDFENALVDFVPERDM